MRFRPFRVLVGMALIALLVSIGCGGSGAYVSPAVATTSSSTTTPTGTTTQPGAPTPPGTPTPPVTTTVPVTPSATAGTVSVLVSDDATDNWATVGIKVLGISLVPQGGGAPVVVFTAPSPTPVINLVQLDQLGEFIGNAAVPNGTYIAANLTLSANSGDVTLISSAGPETGFDVLPGATIPASNIQIQGASGSAGSLTVPLTIRLLQPITVASNSTNALDLEFDLKHPAFIVEHWPASSDVPLWAIDFGRNDLNGPVRHHPVYDLTDLVLRHTLGQVTAVSTDKTAITINKDYVTYPVPLSGQVSPITSPASLNVLADAVNGTTVYDVDTNTKTTIKTFTSVATSLLTKGVGKYVRIAARYQSDGSLVAVRIWASTQFQNVWFSPEGHVVHVDRTNQVMTVSDENGIATPVTIGADTLFYFRTPQDALADSTSIGKGALFFDGFTTGALPNVARGFKVHVTIDPLLSPPTADTVDIEVARYDGTVTSPIANNSFIYTHPQTVQDEYQGRLYFITNASANGTDPYGNPVTGLDWWYFAYPTLADTGANAIPDFVAAIGAEASFGGTVSIFDEFPWGTSYCSWGDGNASTAATWFAKNTIIEPTPLPKAIVSTPCVATANGGSFGMTVAGGSNSEIVNLSSVPGSAALVYQVDNTNQIVTVTQRDLTAVQQALVTGTQIKVFGVPATSGTVTAYVLFYYTGTTPR